MYRSTSTTVSFLIFKSNLSFSIADCPQVPSTLNKADPQGDDHMNRSHHPIVFFALLLIVLTLWTSGLSAQTQTGIPKHGSFSGGPFDTINLANLNAHYVFPVFHKPGRGLSFNFDLSMDTSFWQPVTSGSSQTWAPASGWGWGGSELNVGS